jgi:signal transduction histidine kinase
METDRDPAILGMICSLQTSFHVVPTYEQIAAMIERGLQSVPGLAASTLRISTKSHPGTPSETPPPSRADQRSIELRTATASYGAIELDLDDVARYEPYQPFLKNLANSIATEVENRERAIALEKTQRQLKRERKRLAEELAYKDDFLALLGHELRNPLAAIFNAISILDVLGIEDKYLDRAVDVLKRQSAHLKRMVDDLLDVARISRERLHLQCEPLDLREVLEHTAHDHRPRFDKAGLDFVVSLPDTPMPIEGDRTRLTQVLDNLLDNARKFTEAPGRVELSAECRANPSEVIVSVCDTGVGIEEELLDTLFAPFKQLRDPHSEPQDGIGLGLSLVQGLVDAHGGTVEVDSAGPGHGTTFCVRLPLIDEPDQAQPATSA